MKGLKNIALNAIDLMLTDEPEYRDGDTFFYKIDKEIEIEHGLFLLIKGEGEQEIKKEYPRTHDDEGCFEMSEATYDIDCTIFDEKGTILEFNLNK